MQLDYTKFKTLQNSRELSDRGMAKVIGMTSTGYVKMLQKKSCSVSTLVRISAEFNKPLEYFFDKDDNQANEKGEDYTIKKIDCLECIAKQKKLDQLEKERDEFRAKYIECLEDLAGKKKAVS